MPTRIGHYHPPPVPRGEERAVLAYLDGPRRGALTTVGELRTVLPGITTRLLRGCEANDWVTIAGAGNRMVLAITVTGRAALARTDG